MSNFQPNRNAEIAAKLDQIRNVFDVFTEEVLNDTRVDKNLREIGDRFFRNNTATNCEEYSDLFMLLFAKGTLSAPIFVHPDNTVSTYQDIVTAVFGLVPEMRNNGVIIELGYNYTSNIKTNTFPKVDPNLSQMLSNTIVAYLLTVTIIKVSQLNEYSVDNGILTAALDKLKTEVAKIEVPYEMAELVSAINNNFEVPEVESNAVETIPSEEVESVEVETMTETESTIDIDAMVMERAKALYPKLNEDKITKLLNRKPAVYEAMKKSVLEQLTDKTVDAEPEPQAVSVEATNEKFNRLMSVVALNTLDRIAHEIRVSILNNRKPVFQSTVLDERIMNDIYASQFSIERDSDNRYILKFASDIRLELFVPVNYEDSNCLYTYVSEKLSKQLQLTYKHVEQGHDEGSMLLLNYEPSPDTLTALILLAFDPELDNICAFEK